MPEEVQKHRFGKYILKQTLGHGGMGTVYLAEDPESGNQLALKILSPTIAANNGYTRRFLNEARLAAQLNHPNIVRVCAYGQERGHYYLAMQYIDGQTCRARVVRAGKLPWVEAVRIARQVAEGLAAAARQGIIHRDIKPENILIDQEGRALITDLGLAKEVGAMEPIPSDTSLGTPDYMSPEQVNNSETVDLRSDIYSLGATLFHLICGKAPFTGRSAYEVMVKHVSAELPSPLRSVPDLPHAVRDVMRKMMAREADDRYQTYEELIADLDALLASQPVSATQFDDESMIGANGASHDATAQPRSRKLLWLAAATVPVLGFFIYLLVAH